MSILHTIRAWFVKRPKKIKCTHPKTEAHIYCVTCKSYRRIRYSKKGITITPIKHDKTPK